MIKQLIGIAVLSIGLLVFTACGNAGFTICPNCNWDFELGEVVSMEEVSDDPFGLNGLWQSDRSGGVVEIYGNRIMEREIWVQHWPQIPNFDDWEETNLWWQKMRDMTDETFLDWVQDVYAEVLQPPNVRPRFNDFGGLGWYYVQILTEPTSGTFTLTDDDRIEIIWDSHIEWQDGEMVEVNRGILVYSFDRTENTISFGFAGTGSAQRLNDGRYVRVME